MFDRLGWHHEYEPVDLAGYIPDFLLLDLGPAPIAVECKPYAIVDASVVAHCNRVARSGWKSAALVLGAVQHLSWIDGAIGIGRAMVPAFATWTNAYLGRAADGRWLPRVDLAAINVTQRGAPLALTGHDFMTARMHWSDAGNETQWMPDRPAPTSIPSAGVKRHQ